MTTPNPSPVAISSPDSVRAAEALMLWRLFGCEPGDRVRLRHTSFQPTCGWVLGKERDPESEQLIADIAWDTREGTDTQPGLVSVALLEPVPA